MWRGSLPGTPGPWPPLGELGGVGVFTLLLVLGAAVAVSVAWQHVAVRAAAALAAGAWVWRMHLAASLSATGSVQLYPRTTMVVLTCLLTMAVFAALSLASRRAVEPGRSVVPWLVGVLMVSAFASSSTADRYMPNPDGLGFLAQVAQTSRLPDGTCPRYAEPEQCHEAKTVGPVAPAATPVGPPAR